MPTTPKKLQAAPYCLGLHRMLLKMVVLLCGETVPQVSVSLIKTGAGVALSGTPASHRGI